MTSFTFIPPHILHVTNRTAEAASLNAATGATLEGPDAPSRTRIPGSLLPVPAHSWRANRPPPPCPRLKDPLLVPRSQPASKGSDMESSISGEPAPAAKGASGEGPRAPVRQTPTKYGSAEAMMTMGIIAAPLAAGSLAACIRGCSVGFWPPRLKGL
jgi:hypothetical protein